MIGTAAALLASAAFSGGTAAATSIVGGKQAGKSARNAAQIEAASADKALAFQQQAEATRHQEWQAAEDARKATEAQNREDFMRSEAERKAAWEAQEARAAPYREAADSALRDLARRRGMTVQTQLGARSMPANWGLTPGQAAPSAASGGYVWSAPQSSGSSARMPSSASSDASMLDLINRSRQGAYVGAPQQVNQPIYRPQQTVWGGSPMTGTAPYAQDTQTFMAPDGMAELIRRRQMTAQY